VLVPLLLALLIVAGELGQPMVRAGDPKARQWAALGGARARARDTLIQRAPSSDVAHGKSQVLAMVSEGTGEANAPGAAASMYVTTTRVASARRRGCGFARRVNRNRALRDSIVIMDFGRQARRRRTFGVSLFGHGFRSTRAIGAVAEWYAAGFDSCIRRTDHAHLVLAVGTSNYGSQISWRHGVEWASMVNGVAAWVGRNGLGNRVAIAGAIDMELGWNGPWRSRRWVAGYGSVAQHPYFDFGDAAGCPPRGNCVGGWRVEDVWYVSWGAPWALPLPEIYAPNGSSAREWQRLSLYSKLHHGRAMTIAGVMSQHAACRQSADPCWGMNNWPGHAWRLLHRALNSDPRTAQPLRWLTDVRWDH
jgi:hypothetical protein